MICGFALMTRALYSSLNNKHLNKWYIHLQRRNNVFENMSFVLQITLTVTVIYLNILTFISLWMSYEGNE
jgi:hypothetical protein